MMEFFFDSPLKSILSSVKCLILRNREHSIKKGSEKIEDNPLKNQADGHPELFMRGNPIFSKK